MTKATMICDLQFGSTGKGLIAGYLAEKLQPDAVVTAWMPNAGHTYISASGRKWIHTMLANGIVSKNLKKIFIGPGSMINVDNLIKEIGESWDLVKNAEIFIHPHAGVVSKENKENEKMMESIGSTQKGCGQAIVSKIRRDPENPAVAKNILSGTELGKYICTVEEYNEAMDSCEHLLIEGAQGFSLSIHHGFYPYVTSRDVTPAQILADCAVPYTYLTKVVGCMRVHPIRVANRYDNKGEMIGYSGPTYRDSNELTWREIGVEPELTTVTKLERRVFSISYEQLAQAFRMCSPHELFVNFANYIEDPNELSEILFKINATTRHSGNNTDLRYIGMGATMDDVIDNHHESLKPYFGGNYQKV